MKLMLEVTLLSDTCFSMPASNDPVVDVEPAVDYLGLPMIPGKTLHGLLRDTWLSCQDQLDPGGKIGARLLGLPRETIPTGVVRIGDARLSHEAVDWMARWRQSPDGSKLSTAAFREAFGTARVMTAVDKLTEAPAKETYRVVRAIHRGLKLYAPVTCMRELKPEERELLELLAKLTRHAGLHRNRGFGHIQMEIKDLTETSPTASDFTTPQRQGTVFLHYSLTLNAPCIVGSVQVEPNSQTTLNYLPGATIRGAVAAALVSQGLEEGELTRILCSGQVRFLNAYPAYDHTRSLPASVSWRRKKDATKKDTDDETAARDEALTLIGLQEPQPEGGQRVSLNHEYWVEESASGLYPCPVDTVSDTHQRRNRGTGVTSKGAELDTVFTYEAIAKGQTFRGCIALDGSDRMALEALQNALARPLLIGRSARAQYGGEPTFELLSGLDPTTETGSGAPTFAAGDTVIFRLTSHAVLRNPETGELDPWQLRHAAMEALGDAFEPLGEHALVRADYVRGYNAKWQCDTGAAPCAKAGSVVLFKAKRALSAEEVARIQSQPIGERTAEGLGCFILERWRGDRLILQERKETTVPPPTGKAPQELVKAQERLYRKVIRQALASQAVDLAEKGRNLPSPSLIQRLRVPLRERDWRATWRTWLGTNGAGDSQAHALARKAREALEEMQLNGKAFHKFLDEASQQQFVPGDPWALAGERQRLDFIPREEADRLWHRLWREEDSVVFFLDTLLAQLAKQAQQQHG